MSEVKGQGHNRRIIDKYKCIRYQTVECILIKLKTNDIRYQTVFTNRVHDERVNPIDVGDQRSKDMVTIDQSEKSQIKFKSPFKRINIILSYILFCILLGMVLHGCCGMPNIYLNPPDLQPWFLPCSLPGWFLLLRRL